MLSFRRSSSSADAPVLSFGVMAAARGRARNRSQFEVLVGHLLHRFFHNELLAWDDETKRVLQVCYAVSVPGLLVALFLFPLYHAFPPAPYPRPFWSQVSDHYFYVTYAFVIMGIATVYEWDLLFPDLLDVFVLSPLPIEARRLFAARVTALVIFLGLVLAGTSVCGTLMLPLVAELPHAGRHFLAHAVAVAASGIFTAAALLAVQGILLATVGERFFRRFGPVLQSISLMLLLTVLLLFPAASPEMRHLLGANVTAIRYFPPMWFLGLYERVLGGPACLPIFRELAHTGLLACAGAIGAAFVTYPIAYRRRVRQIIEGSAVKASPARSSAAIGRAVDCLIVRNAAQRAIFHLISQTVLRAQRHRVMLAMYAGLALSLIIADTLVLRVDGAHLHPQLLPTGIRAAIPVTAFWTVAALKAAIGAPLDRRGAWIFHTIHGNASHDHLTGARLWISAWTLVLCSAVSVLFYVVSPSAIHTPHALIAHLLVGAGLSFLLPQLMLHGNLEIPFTYVRRSSVTDFPFAMGKYIVLLPAFVFFLGRFAGWLEKGWLRCFVTAGIFAGLYVRLRSKHSESLRMRGDDLPPGDAGEFQTLGLMELG